MVKSLVSQVDKEQIALSQPLALGADRNLSARYTWPARVGYNSHTDEAAQDAGA